MTAYLGPSLTCQKWAASNASGSDCVFFFYDFRLRGKRHRVRTHSYTTEIIVYVSVSLKNYYIRTLCGVRAYIIAWPQRHAGIQWPYVAYCR